MESNFRFKKFPDDAILSRWKKVAPREGLAIISIHLRGCSSVVEHLLAKEDVASSSLVTRSSFLRSEHTFPAAAGESRFFA